MIEAILNFLQIGMAGFIAFMPVQAEAYPDRIEITLENSHILTDQMIDLLNNGLEFGFELYVSLRTRMPDGTKVLAVQRFRRSIRYNEMAGVFVLVGETGIVRTFGNVKELESAAKRWDKLAFALQPGWISTSIYADIKPIDNAMLKEKFQMSGESLWDGYLPTIIKDVQR